MMELVGFVTTAIGALVLSVILVVAAYVVVVALWGNLGDWEEWRKRNRPT